MKDEKGQNDLEFIIEQHKREIWAYKQRESEWIRTENQLQGTKRIVDELSSKVISHSIVGLPLLSKISLPTIFFILGIHNIIKILRFDLSKLIF